METEGDRDWRLGKTQQSKARTRKVRQDGQGETTDTEKHNKGEVDKTVTTRGTRELRTKSTERYC